MFVSIYIKIYSCVVFNVTMIGKMRAKRVIYIDKGGGE